eukprot:6189894-Pleurochrysis_carterae.AAC.2
MPKSKRDQKVTLSRTVKKGRDRKLGIMEEVRSCVDKYSNCYVFAAEGMRNAALKDVRALLKSSSYAFPPLAAPPVAWHCERIFVDLLYCTSDVIKRLLSQTASV